MKKKKKLATLVIAAVMVLSIGMTVFGAGSKYYSVGTSYVDVVYLTSSSGDTPVSINTRPSTGVAGVDVKVEGTDGTKSEQIFPYYVGRDPWVVTIKEGHIYTISVRSRQGTATGYLYY